MVATWSDKLLLRLSWLDTFDVENFPTSLGSSAKGNMSRMTNENRAAEGTTKDDFAARLTVWWNSLPDSAIKAIPRGSNNEFGFILNDLRVYDSSQAERVREAVELLKAGRTGIDLDDHKNHSGILLIYRPDKVEEAIVLLTEPKPVGQEET